MRFNHFVKLSGALLLTTGLAGAASANNYGSSYDGRTPHEACKSDENRSQIIGGGIGAVAGAVLGSQVAGNGARTEASVIGGVLGGLAGAGIADKRIDCDPVYRNEGHQTSGYHSSSEGTHTTLPTTTVYGSSPTYSSTHSTGYSQAEYGTRTTVSDHPVYSNPTWGAQPARTYVSQPVSQPVYSQPSYSQPTYQTASYSQPRVVSSTTHYSQPTRTYTRPVTTYSQPRTTYVRSVPARTRHYSGYSSRQHYHGRYSCDDRH